MKKNSGCPTYLPVELNLNIRRNHCAVAGSEMEQLETFETHSKLIFFTAVLIFCFCTFLHICCAHVAHFCMFCLFFCANFVYNIFRLKVFSVQFFKPFLTLCGCGILVNAFVCIRLGAF